MGEMGSPSRGSSSFPYNRVTPSLIEEISAAQFSNSNIRAIEEDLALIRQGEQEQQQQLSDEGKRSRCYVLLIIANFSRLAQIRKMPVKQTSRRKKMNT